VCNAQARKGNDETMIIKNQDPPVIRSPSEQHGRFLSQVEGAGASLPNYLGRRQVLELCNFLFLMSGLALQPPDGGGGGEGGGKKSKGGKAKASATEGGGVERPWPAVTINASLGRFRQYLADGTTEWHPMGSKIPRFSQSHCSTGTVLLVEALLVCRRTRLYGFHACGCERQCGADARLAGRNHYWDRKSGGTPHLDKMMSRYERHMIFYQLLERACGLDFRVARKEHCDA